MLKFIQFLFHRFGKVQNSVGLRQPIWTGSWDQSVFKQSNPTVSCKKCCKQMYFFYFQKGTMIKLHKLNVFKSRCRWEPLRIHGLWVWPILAFARQSAESVDRIYTPSCAKYKKLFIYKYEFKTLLLMNKKSFC